jgi:diacylglycerol kinase
MRFLKSFLFAAAGILFCLRQGNFKIQLIAALVAIAASFYLQVTKNEFLLVLLVAALVLILEMINTALEHLCNLYTTEQHPEIKIVKDVAAGAVLIASVCSLLIGIFIFLPYLQLKFNL